MANETSLITVELKPVALQQVKEHVGAIRALISDILEDGTDLISIPGVEKKVLSKAGAEKALFYFRLLTSTKTEIVELGSGHREYVATTQIKTAAGIAISEFTASCSTKESKYRYRLAEWVCPLCKATTIKKSKEAEKGFYCWAKLGGCGAQFAADDARIIDQPRGKVENPDIADLYNTCLQMAEKRSMVGATRIGLAMSGMVEADLDEMTPEQLAEIQRQRARKPAGEAKENAIPIEETWKYDFKKAKDKFSDKLDAANALVREAQASIKGGVIYSPNPIEEFSDCLLSKPKSLEDQQEAVEEAMGTDALPGEELRVEEEMVLDASRPIQEQLEALKKQVKAKKGRK